MARNPLLKGKSKSGNNPDGANGVGNGEWPDDEALNISLHKYAAERLSLHQRIGRLKKDHNGFTIGTTLLKKLNKHYNVPSARKPPPREVATQLVLNKMSEDNNRRQGSGTIGTLLAIDGTPVPRATIRRVMLLNDSSGVDSRFPGKKDVRRRGLTGHGIFQEHHCDGHEKLGKQALMMGPVGLPIYGIKDHWGMAIVYLRVLPNDRLADAIGHAFLDFVEDYGVIPQQMTFDGGTETGEMAAFQTALKSNYAPEIDQAVYPATKSIPSTNNTPIEGFWHWLREIRGYNLYDDITRGKQEGIFNPNNDIHVALFNWIWPPIVQGELDAFTEYWNTHKIRKQKNKSMPSGVSPTELFTNPEAYGGQSFAIPVPKHAIPPLRSSISMSREEAFHWPGVDLEFDAAASRAYEELGCPQLTSTTAWTTFMAMAPLIYRV